MGVDPDLVRENDPKASKVKHKNKVNGEEGVDIGCWGKLNLMKNCKIPKQKIASSASGAAQNGLSGESKSGKDKSSGESQAAGNASSLTGSYAGSTSTTSLLSDEVMPAAHLREFTFDGLKGATKNFKPDSVLGEGGFGRVFKGWIEEHGVEPSKPGTGITVAVKVLNNNGNQGHREWLAEIKFLGNLIHPNLVKLIGYCIENDQRLLVYEFMQRGSLENHLFRRSNPLSWLTRMRIALDAAMGIAFLHEEAETPVIYRDFKSSNVLLDADYRAKLSDFGLAKDGPDGDKSHVSTRVMGTHGYAAPEYVLTGHLTPMNDVYSFGVVLLELLSGRRSMDKSRPFGEHNLVQWARPLLGDKRKLYRVIDTRFAGKYPIKAAQAVAHLAAQCVSQDPKSRPQMSGVVKDLERVLTMKDMAGSHFSQSSDSVPKVNLGSKNGLLSRSRRGTQAGQSSQGFALNNRSASAHELLPPQRGRSL